MRLPLTKPPRLANRMWLVIFVTITEVKRIMEIEYTMHG